MHRLMYSIHIVLTDCTPNSHTQTHCTPCSYTLTAGLCPVCNAKKRSLYLIQRHTVHYAPFIEQAHTLHATFSSILTHSMQLCPSYSFHWDKDVLDFALDTTTDTIIQQIHKIIQTYNLCSHQHTSKRCTHAFNEKPTCIGKVLWLNLPRQLLSL